MNKTVNINLGGIVFHIDEDAFEILNNYLNMATIGKWKKKVLLVLVVKTTKKTIFTKN